jgi:LmbE family N-acetylglucosaminyl deacetylase
MGIMTPYVTPIDEAIFSRLVVVSPHFDDAVLGVGCLLAQHAPATVVTVMGGPRPDGHDTVTWWDSLGGFEPGDDVVARRQDEDVKALAELGAASTWLQWSDNQYDVPFAGAQRPSADDVAASLEEHLVPLEPTAVVVPLGLANPDHLVTGEACLRVRARHPEWTWLGYAESGYASIPGVLAMRVRDIVRQHGVWPTPAPLRGHDHLAAKRRAMAHYVSQIPALAEDWGFDPAESLAVPESLWRLDPLPPAWGEVPF